VVVYFFLLEAQGKSLEEVDNMYRLHVKPWKSKNYVPEAQQESVSSHKLALTSVGEGINEGKENGLGNLEQREKAS